MSTTPRLRRLSRVAPPGDMDTVSYTRREQDNHRGFDIVMQAQDYWYGMEQFRRDRRRAKRYNYGDQWGDLIKDDDGHMVTEEQYIRQQGSEPLKNNLIRRLVKSVLGVYRSQAKQPTCFARDPGEKKLGETMTAVLQANMDRNEMGEMYARGLEEYMISGMVVHMKWYGWNDQGQLDCWTRDVKPDLFIVDNKMKDFRTWDVSFIGEVHDMRRQEVCSRFAKSPADYKRIMEIYHNARDVRYLSYTAKEFGYSQLDDTDFLVPDNPSMCRVIEVWRREMKPRYRCVDYNTGEVFKCETKDWKELVGDVNAERLALAKEQGMPVEEVPLIKYEWALDEYWYYYFVAPTGEILDEGETPYEHKSHPYVFRAYPFIDGEIHSFVSDVIDQQRYTNRLITMYDWIMKASAKGVLLFPEDCLPDGYDINDIADEWARFNGVIMIAKRKENAAMPQQIANNATNIGISELLNLQLKFFEDISGVHGAIQGQTANSGVSGALYAQQSQNATISLLDLLDSYSAFIKACAFKDVKMLQQFYDEKRTFAISGRSVDIVWEPNRIRDVEFDLNIAESTSTPVYRQMANEFLLEIWRSGQINLQQMLENGDFPFSDDLLQSIKGQEEAIAQGQVPEGIANNLREQIQQGADMNAVGRAYNMLRRPAMQNAA